MSWPAVPWPNCGRLRNVTTDAVFCDDLRVTIPDGCWHEAESDLRSVLDVLGAQTEFKAHDRTGWRLEDGTARSQKCGRVWSFSASGKLLAGLRAADLLGQFLAALATGPHRVTGIHCTIDRKEPTPPVIERLLKAAESEQGLRVSRKAVSPQAIQRHVVRNAAGVDTGTAYFGKRFAEVRAVVYDKRQELIDRGNPDLGHDLTRYELRLRSQVGATLGDAMYPAPLFWHYMAPDVLTAPDGVPPWVANAMGYELEPLRISSFAERLQSRVYASDDLADILRLAHQVEGGFDLLVSMLRARFATSAPVVS